jgi:hypothetical protein
MVGLQRHEDLIPPLDAARNLKVEDRIPLLFLDEFDSEAGNFPLLLPLLWDGELTVGQHDLKLGKVVIVLAGSDPTLPGTIEYARSLRREPPPQSSSHHPKLVDLLSRINGGVLRIPNLSDESQASNRQADKVCIAARLLRQRFGSALKRAPLALLKFTGKTEFRYGVRSMAHLIDLIPYKKGVSDLPLADLKLPLGDAQELKSSSLAYHLVSEDQALGAVNLWEECIRTEAEIMIGSQTLDRFSGAADPFLADFVVRRLADECSEIVVAKKTQPGKGRNRK